jgi:DNA-binding MarR family transcriptional regulator
MTTEQKKALTRLIKHTSTALEDLEGYSDDDAPALRRALQHAKKVFNYTE